MEVVTKTVSGHFIKDIKDYGLTVFSPYTGLTHAVSELYSEDTLNWLNQKPHNKLPKNIESELSIGWKKPYKTAKFSSNHILPSRDFWENTKQPNQIIAINWFLTGKCNFQCKYCYAQDLMYGNTTEPTEDEILETADRILKLNPLFVVLTGGEPLLSPHVRKVVNRLSKKTGIVIDTNGTLLDIETIKFFKENNVVIRISLDSSRPRENAKLRIHKSDPEYFNTILNNIITCQEKEIPLIIQTVATKLNKNDLPSMGDTIHMLGIKGWRVLSVQLTNIENKNLFGKDVLKYNYGRNLDTKYKELVHLHKTRWNSSFSLQITQNKESDKNAVILVSADGRFWTQSHIDNKKVMLDPINPFTPNHDTIFQKINIYAHFARYLNF